MAKKKAATTRSQKLRPHVKKILSEAAKHPKRPFLTAFQILDLLGPKVRQKLIQETGSPGGDKAHVRRAASMDIKDAARSVATEVVHMSTSGVEFTIDGQKLPPSSKETIALYRIVPSKTGSGTAKPKATKVLQHPQNSGEDR
ncbi:hypothetical protein [Planctomicrobium sp. SH664]|uniref:hypothetical protein n=1 Tax=Planctomicrobium sp. SH664 TaxID=3448125 RepID=UPI003F5B0740